VRKYLRGGLRVSVADNESAARISFTAQTGGETNLRSVLETLAETIEFERAFRHDRKELELLGDLCEDWFGKNRDELAKMKESDRRDAIKAVTIESLFAAGMGGTDGLRSAFDPAMAEKFKAMLKNRGDKLGEAATDLSESGFEWFGLPADEKVIRSDNEYGYDRITDAWLVAASRGAWAAGGRVCLIQTGMNYRVVWLSEDDYNALKLSNVSGGRLKTFKPKVEQPLWKVKFKLWRQRYEAESLQRTLEQALRQEDGTYREFSFKGSEHDDPVKALREALKLADDQFWFNADTASRLIVEVKDKSSKVRIEMDGQWIEIDEKGKITTSWSDE
jgi:hypothetical protein